MKYQLISYLALAFIFSIGADAQEADSTMSEAELAKLHRELDNPLAKRWSLVFQENIGINKGDLVDGNVVSNTFFFQPALPIPFGRNKVFTARPVFPIVTQPDFSADANGNKKVSGFGDIQMAALFGPGNAKGLVWGLGATFVFPTASDKSLGQGKWQAGPTFMLFHLAEIWNKGVFIQHWWSYAGDNERADVALTDFQYVIRRNFSNWSLGMGPSIKIDWKQGWDDGVTIPIGFGYTKTALVGKTPFKLRIEPQYSIYRSSDYGNVWNIRIQIAPVIKSPFV